MMKPVLRKPSRQFSHAGGFPWRRFAQTKIGRGFDYTTIRHMVTTLAPGLFEIELIYAGQLPELENILDLEFFKKTDLVGADRRTMEFELFLYVGMRIAAKEVFSDLDLP